MPKSVPDTSTLLVRAAADLRALLRYLVEVVELQQHEPDLKNHEEAAELLESAIPVLCRELDQLDQYLERTGSGKQSVQLATSSMAGAFLGFITKLRSHETVKILRDDFTLLNLAAVNCLALHTAASTLNDVSLASIALQCRTRLLQFTDEIVRLMPQLVQQELARTFATTRSPALEASRETSPASSLQVMPTLAATA